MERRNADGFVFHAVELRFPYLEDNVILDVLGFRIGQFIKQLAYAVCIKYRCITQRLCKR